MFIYTVNNPACGYLYESLYETPPVLFSGSVFVCHKRNFIIKVIKMCGTIDVCNSLKSLEKDVEIMWCGTSPLLLLH